MNGLSGGLFPKLIVLALFALILSLSVTFKRLDDQTRRLPDEAFDAHEFARLYWREKLLPDMEQAVEVQELHRCVSEDVRAAAAEYGHTLGIASVHAFLVRGEGLVASVSKEKVDLIFPGSDLKVSIRTGLIFGNAIRDATGEIDVNDYPSSRDFNNISSAFNQLVQTEVIPSFMEEVRRGLRVRFAGACEVDEDNLELSTLSVVPVRLEIIGSKARFE